MEELHNLCTLHLILLRILNQAENMDATCTKHGRSKKCRKNLLQKPKGKKPLARPKYRREDNNKINYREINCENTQNEPN
jgi:hypothetical protein